MGKYSEWRDVTFHYCSWQLSTNLSSHDRRVGQRRHELPRQVMLMSQFLQPEWLDGDPGTWDLTLGKLAGSIASSAELVRISCHVTGLLQ